VTTFGECDKLIAWSDLSREQYVTESGDAAWGRAYVKKITITVYEIND